MTVEEVIMFRLTKPSARFALATVFATCLFYFRSLATVTPKYFADDLLMICGSYRLVINGLGLCKSKFGIYPSKICYLGLS